MSRINKFDIILKKFFSTPIQEHNDAFSNWDGTINETSENLTRQANYIHESLTGSQKKLSSIG